MLFLVTHSRRPLPIRPRRASGSRSTAADPCRGGLRRADGHPKAGRRHWFFIWRKRDREEGNGLVYGRFVKAPHGSARRSPPVSPYTAGVNPLKGYPNVGYVVDSTIRLLMKRLAAVAALAASTWPARSSTKRSLLNLGAQSFLHIRPQSGVWQIGLVQTAPEVRPAPEDKTECIVMTGYHNLQTGERYWWGFRQQALRMAAIIIDRNSEAVKGSEIEIIVDGATIGDFSIVFRKTENGFNGIRSDLSSKDASAVRSLVAVGGIRFRTQTATYSASLAGALRVMQNITSYSVESNQTEFRRSRWKLRYFTTPIYGLYSWPQLGGRRIYRRQSDLPRCERGARLA